MRRNRMQEIASAPASARAHLTTLSLLYGISCLDKDAAFFLCASALDASDVAVLHADLKAHCRTLMANGGSALRLLCDGFGIPDHCLQAPIAFDWKKL